MVDASSGQPTPPPGMMTLYCYVQCILYMYYSLFPENPQRWWKNSKNVLCSAITISVVLLLLNGILFSIITAASSTSAPVYTDDVVRVWDVEGFWYNKITITYTAPSDTDIPAKVEIYYTDNSSTEQEMPNCTSLQHNFSFPEEISNCASLLHTFSFPEGIPIQQSFQVYLLQNSGIEFNFTVVNASEFAESAKVCQFSNVDDYDALLQAETNESIVKAERNGDCQPMLASPNIFQIEHDGYYWYAVSTLFGSDVLASYTYNLSKLSYNKTTLGRPHDCTATDYECSISGIISQTSTKHVFVIVSNSASSKPYIIKVKARNAIGIAIVVFVPVELMTVVLCLCMCMLRYRKSCSCT